ncbi:hypothetical protein GJAV_G00244190 [Gymnothorax javanicus]|nr:hypothetical protein GJAV_G00244190 [Gymnothorax javanicus]
MLPLLQSDLMGRSSLGPDEPTPDTADGPLAKPDGLCSPPEPGRRPHLLQPTPSKRPPFWAQNIGSGLTRLKEHNTTGLTRIPGEVGGHLPYHSN